MNRRELLIAGGCCALAGLAPLRAAFAGPFDYALRPMTVAPDTHVLLGTTEYFSRDNGGNIVNTGFIVTGDGVVVIDTGPSLRYGQQMRAAIAAATDRPVAKVLNTHLHPDHFLGNGAFDDRPITAGEVTRDLIRRDGDALAENLYRLVGDWMRGTRSVEPTQVLSALVEEIGGHRLRYLLLNGHTPSDLAVLDEGTGVLFASDLVFHDRMPTTPHADLKAWMASLDVLAGLSFTVLVPGHGAVARDRGPIQQTRAYVAWLDATFDEAARAGLSMTEAMRLPLPPEFAGMALAREEFERSVVHLYPARLKAALPAVAEK